MWEHETVLELLQFEFQGKESGKSVFSVFGLSDWSTMAHSEVHVLTDWKFKILTFACCSTFGGFGLFWYFLKPPTWSHKLDKKLNLRRVSFRKLSINFHVEFNVESWRQTKYLMLSFQIKNYMQNLRM